MDICRHCERSEAIQGFCKYFCRCEPSTKCWVWQSRVFIIIAIFLSILLPASSFAKDIKTIKPYLGSIQKSFTEPAETHLEKTYSINMPIEGELERVRVREGDRVEEGQVLAIMEQEPLKQAVNKAEANLETIKSKRSFQQTTVSRYQKLKNFVEKAELDQVVSEEKVLKAEEEEAASNLAIAEYNLEQSTLISPITGIILDRYSQGGKWLQAGTPVLRIGDLKDLEVISDVLTQEAQELRVGDSVVLSSIGTTSVLKGKVKQIYPAGFTKKSSLGVDEQRVNVIIKIENPEKTRFGLGYRLQAKFFIGTKEKKALIIPRFSVLQDSKGNYYVFVVKDEEIYKRIVKLGVLTDERVSVLDGLSTNDLIVDQPTADMKDGMSL